MPLALGIGTGIVHGGAHLFPFVKLPATAPSTGVYYAGGTGQFTGSKTFDITFRWDAAPPGASIGAIGGLGRLTGGSIFTRQDTGSTKGKLLGFCSAGYAPGTSSLEYGHVVQSGDVGRIYRSTIVADGSELHLYHCGRHCAIASAAFAGTLGEAGSDCSIGAWSINHDQFGNGISVFDVQVSNTALSAAQVLAAYQAGIGSLIPGVVNHWRAQDATASTWVDAIGGLTLTKGGSGTPTFGSAAYGTSWAGEVSIFGDSRSAGWDGTADGDGWRLPFFNQMFTLGKPFMICGMQAAGADATHDYDNRHSAQDSHTMALMTAGTPSEFQSRMAAESDPSGVTCTSDDTGLNDCILNASSSTTMANMRSTLIDQTWAARPGTLIVVRNIPRVSTSHGATALNTLEDYNTNQLPNLVASKKAAGVTIALFDARAAITPTQADADNTNVLFDGVHYTAATNSAYGVSFANFLAGLL